MTSAKKIAANRLNGCKSRGPRTKAGKAAASRNARRHGLNAISYANPSFAREIEQRARSFCDGDPNPHLLRYAIIVAECDVVLQCVQRERVAAIERCRDADALAHANGDNSIALAKGHSLKTELAFAELERMGVTFADGEAVIPEYLEADGECRVYASLYPPAKERDELDAFCEALPDLLKLDRYERRALSARKRALRDFVGMLSRGRPSGLIESIAPTA